jgi:hypothetical protein
VKLQALQKGKVIFSTWKLLYLLYA